MDAIASQRRVRSASLGWPLIGSKTACVSENNAWISSVFMMLMKFNGHFCRNNCMCCCAWFSIAIFDCDLWGAWSFIEIFAQSCKTYWRVILIAIIAPTFLRLQYSRELFFWLRSLIAIFVRDCYLFGTQFSIAIFARTLLWTRLVRTLSLSDFLLLSDPVFLEFLFDDAEFWIGFLPSDAALSDSVSFGGCFFLWTLLVRTLSVLDFISRLDVVSFGISFGRCGVLMRLLSFGRGSFGCRLFRMLLPWFFWTLSLSNVVSFGCGCSSSDADSILWTRILLFLWTRMLFLGRFCSSSDVDAFLGRCCFLRHQFLRGSVDNLYLCTMIYLYSFIE